MSFERIPVDGSEKMPDDLMDSIEPFDYSEIVPFDPGIWPAMWPTGSTTTRTTACPRHHPSHEQRRSDVPLHRL
jgi:hypothetical protein